MCYINSKTLGGSKQVAIDVIVGVAVVIYVINFFIYLCIGGIDIH